ncbi:hypothetical protein BHE74_00000007 [Ensete ventricosum]|nr:hypothetical protein BHE74_00000007 [Ensete ventricosum]
MRLARAFADRQVEAKQARLADARRLLGDAQLPMDTLLQTALMYATGQRPRGFLIQHAQCGVGQAIAVIDLRQRARTLPKGDQQHRLGLHAAGQPADIDAPTPRAVGQHQVAAGGAAVGVERNGGAGVFGCVQGHLQVSRPVLERPIRRLEAQGVQVEHGLGRVAADNRTCPRAAQGIDHLPDHLAFLGSLEPLLQAKPHQAGSDADQDDHHQHLQQGKTTLGVGHGRGLFPVAQVGAVAFAAGLAILAIEDQVEGTVLAREAIAEGMAKRVFEVRRLGVRACPSGGVGRLVHQLLQGLGRRTDVQAVAFDLHRQAGQLRLARAVFALVDVAADLAHHDGRDDAQQHDHGEHFQQGETALAACRFGAHGE